MAVVRVKGYVKFYSADKGWGFIVPEDQTPDVFVHKTDVPPELKSLAPDQRVTFEIVETGKGNGRRATQLQAG